MHRERKRERGRGREEERELRMCIIFSYIILTYMIYNYEFVVEERDEFDTCGEYTYELVVKAAPRSYLQAPVGVAYVHVQGSY